MGFVTPALIGGALLVGVPIVLHLVMRRQAQQLVFPALRFVQRRRSANQTRLRLRHLLLLALRCAVIAFLALGLARPSIRGSGQAVGKNAPIAVAVVIDNSLRMEYRQRNRTRLAEAQQLADWLLEQLPADTPVAVLARSDRHRSFSVDRSAAQLKVSRLATSAVARPLHETIGDAIDVLGEKKEYRPEIYVFTDMAESDWSEEALGAVGQALDKLPGVLLYVIDVGAERPENVGLGPIRLNGEVLTRGSQLKLDTALHQTGEPDGEPAERGYPVELYIEDAEGNPQKRGEQTVRPDEGPLAAAHFSLAGLEIGTHQGFVRIAANDPLNCDDTRYFSVEVRPPRKVLLVCDQPEGAVFVREALAPSRSTGAGPPRFDCQVVRPGALTGAALAEFDAVCLLDVGPLQPVVWRSLTDYVEAGGGLAVYLGRNADREALAGSDASRLLAGTLRWQSRDSTYLQPVSVDHPVLLPIRDYAESIPWSAYPVMKYWELADTAEETYVVLSYANGKPAILERIVGKGRVLTMTTPVSDAAHRNPWNLLPTGPDPWPFLALTTGMVDYLCGGRDDRLNYEAGQTATLHIGPSHAPSNYVLQMPGGQALRQAIPPGSEQVVITSTTEVGNYRLQAGGTSGGLDRGFSVNVDPASGDLRRATFPAIQEALGKDRVKLARTQDQIEVQVGLGRVGWELFPWLIGAVAIVLGAEHLLANRFYKTSNQ